MGSPIDLPVPADNEGARAIAPTDVAQFIRLEQCARYLRLSLHECACGGQFMRDYGVRPEAIPELLPRSGAAFEARVEQAVRARYRVVNFTTDVPAVERENHNALVLDYARALPPGETTVLFQPRIQARLGDWRVRGDVDILRLERDRAGALHALIADMKASVRGKLEHRLQVAFYVEMLDALLREAGLACDRIDLGVLYRGSPHGDAGLSPEAVAERAAQREAAERLLGVPDALLDVAPDPLPFREAVRDLVFDRQSIARRVVEAPFDDVPFHLAAHCDACRYNEFCLKWSAERDDLSLLPHLTALDKGALQRAGVGRIRDLALLKQPANGARDGALVPAPNAEGLVRELSVTWPVGPRLDELVHRARRYRWWKGDPVDAPPSIPGTGHASLPYCDERHNPNLVTVYLDAQHDYIADRVYLLGALVVAHERGRPVRREHVVRMTERAPTTAEQEEALFLDWIRATLRAIVRLAAPDETGERRAPIHLIFFDRSSQRVLLQGLARHFERVFGATPLYDFVTQIAAFDSALISYLDEEIREHKNFPMLCQSLQSVATFLKFDWNTPQPYRKLFRHRMFDYVGKLEENGKSDWYTRRARFSSQIPLEYAYAAWDDLPAPSNDSAARAVLQVDRDTMLGFERRRLDALEHIARSFQGNEKTQKTLFDLPDLARFEEKATCLAQALHEFVVIERHAALSTWKSARLAPPERRVLSGETLLVRYCAEDQPPEVVAQIRESARRQALREEYEEELRAANPDAPRVELTKEQKDATKWSYDGLRVRLRVVTDGVDCDLDEALALSTIREGDRIVVCPRWETDSRLPRDQRTPFTPTPKQMLYGARADVERIVVERDEAGKAVEAFAELKFTTTNAPSTARGFVFSSFARPLVDGELYTLDPDPNEWHGYRCLVVAEALVSGGPNAVYARLVDPMAGAVDWPPVAAAAQRRFLDGLDALAEAGILPPFGEEGKRAYIGAHGDTPTLLVQGPPGTGKSHTTAFALLARLQGAMAAGRPARALLSCKTHAAVDVLLDKVAEARRLLHGVHRRHPDLYLRYFDERLLDLPLFRVEPRGSLPEGVGALWPGKERGGSAKAWDAVASHPWCVVASTPGGAFKLVDKRWDKKRHGLLGHELFQLLVLDEASQMNLPEATMAALPVAPNGQVLVVGDHRQMPPIVQHDWDREQRRTFREFRGYQSLFLSLLERGVPVIRFEESFRLHAAMASFLREEIYRQDGIPYFSRRRETLPRRRLDDPFVASVLAPEHPLVVVVHDERASQKRNLFEQELIAPVLQTLAEEYRLDPEHGLGVVVPHRAQRAALRDAIPVLNRIDPATGLVTLSAVDTVERFQGGERAVIVVSATESDRDYLLAAGEFLLDPRRLTVALSRAKQKMILVASREIFGLFSTDEEVFANALLWKHLLRRTCTVPLWAGERLDHWVEVWGNAPEMA